MSKKNEFLKDFSDLIRLFSTSLKNGLDFPAGLNAAKPLCSPLLKEEIEKILIDLKEGFRRDECFVNIYKRNPYPEINYFVANFIHSYKLGGNLYEVFDDFRKKLSEEREFSSNIIDLDEYIKEDKEPIKVSNDAITNLNLDDEDSIWAFVVENTSMLRGGDISKDEIKKHLSELLSSNLSKKMEKHKEELFENIYNNIMRYGILTKYFEDKSVIEFCCNSNGVIELIRKDSKEVTSINLEQRKLINIIERIVSVVGKRIDERYQYCEGVSVDKKGSHFHFQGNINLKDHNETVVTLRIVKLLDVLPDIGTLFSKLPGKLKSVKTAIKNKRPVILIGETPFYNQQLLGVFANELEDNTRLAVAQNSDITKIPQLNKIVLTTRPPSLEGEGETTVPMLIKRALQFNPGCLLVDELDLIGIKEIMAELALGNIGLLTTLRIGNIKRATNYLETHCLDLIKQNPLIILIDSDLKVSEIKEYN